MSMGSWVQYSFGKSSGLGSVRCIFFTAASKWPSQHVFTATSPLPVPGIIASASVPLWCPACLAESCYVGACVDLSCVLCLRDTCVSFPQAPELALCVTQVHFVHLFGSQACPLLGGVCVHLSWLPCLPSGAQAGVHLSRLLSPALCFAGLVCTLILAPQDCPLCHRAGVHVFWHSCLHSASQGLCALVFFSPVCPPCRGAYVFFLQLPGPPSVHCPSLYASPLCVHPGPPFVL